MEIKNKKNILNAKIRDFIVIFIIQLVASMPFLIADSYALTISDVKVNDITKNSAMIEWKTDSDANSTVKYGKTKAISSVQKQKDFVSEHSVELAGLSANSDYFFAVESSDSSGARIVENNSDTLYTFKTISGSQSELQPSADETGPPPIEFTVPENYNRRAIDISGSTRPFSSVSIFVNDMNAPKKSLSGNEVGSSGKFSFTQIQLESSNTIKIAATDKNSNKNEKTFEIKVDTEQPAIVLSNISNLLSRPNFTISGTASELVTAKVFVASSAEASSSPPKITGLNSTNIGQNSIEIKWDESKDKDFSHYIVYRNSVAIASTKPSNYNLFIDALVDSGKEYQYEVSAVNAFGNEGQKSAPITAKTLSGGQSISIQYPPLEEAVDSRKPAISENISGSFELKVNLNKGDGTYNIKLVFEDKAGNRYTTERELQLDTKKPTVKITSPGSGAFLYENAANEVTVAGKTKPNARVHLFIDRLPYSLYNTSVEIGGLPNEAIGITDPQNFPKSPDLSVKDVEDRIQDIPEKELESKCGVKGIVSSTCTGADRSVIADKEGNFVFEKVDLSAAFAFATRITQVPVTEIRDVQLNKEARESKKSNIFVIATDKLGQRGFAKQTVNIGTCWSGNQSWDVIPLTEHQSPVFISTERLSEGTETLYFFVNYTYIGRGAGAKIKTVSLQRACGTRELLDPRYNISCGILQAGDRPTKLNEDGTLTYSAIPLGRFENMDRFLESDWKDFFKAINNEMTFPFKVTIRYEHEVIDDQGQIRKMTETQTTCQEFTYVVDNTLLDPRKVLPDFLLYDFVEFLQKSVNALTKVQEQIDKVIDYVAIGCLYSFLANLVFKIYRNWAELSSELTFKLQGVLFNTGNSETDNECDAIAEAIVKGYQLGSKKDLKLKYFSDQDLKKCFPGAYAAWKKEGGIYQWQRWSCDRIFGHSTPSKWTEDREDEELQRKITTQETCAQDGAEKALRVPVTECSKLVGRYREIFNGNNQPLGKKCFEVQSNKDRLDDFYVYELDSNQDTGENSNGIYKLKRYEIRPTTKDIVYVKKVPGTEDYYITAQPRTCEEACGFKQDLPDESISVDGEPWVLEEGKAAVLLPREENKEKEEKDKTVRIAGCVTVNQCREWYAKADSDKDGIKLGNRLLTRYTVESQGYTSECFYKAKPNYGAEVVSETNPNTRRVCCCVNAKSNPEFEIYYKPNDFDPKLAQNFQSPVHEAKDGSAPSNLEDMKWSYRYSRIGYLTKKYNPNRYIEGRDQPACFGQDNLFYKIFGKEEEVLIINPFKQDTAALQCAYLTGVNQRIQMYKNIMSAMSNCLVEIRTSGRADSGVCKELFTQHVCGLIWQAVKFFQDGCTPDYFSDDSEGREANFGEKMKIGFKGISQGISEAQEEITEEYGNAKLNNLLGVGQGGVARKVCLAAFGYDWDLSARNLIDVAYTSPFATLVQPITRSREFLTVDPQTLRSKYEYRASWIVNPGCDLDNYRVELACVSRKELDQYPNDINCGAVGAPSIGTTGALGTSTGYNECDCLNLPSEKTRSFFQVPRLKQNQLSDKDFHDVIESEYRYDHLKFTLRTDRRIPADIQKNCFPQGHENGVFYRPITDKTARDILECKANPLSGIFDCSQGSLFFESKGIAQILGVTINDIDADKAKKDELEFTIGEPLRVTTTVSKTGQPKCLRVSITPDFIQDRYERIDIDGVSSIGPIEITNSLSVAGTRGNYNAPGMAIDLESQNNQNIVRIETKFIDNRNNARPENEKIYSVDDQATIDGFDIDFESSTPFGNVDNDPNLEQSGNTLIIKRDGIVYERITLSGKTIRIEKEDVIVIIRDVSYLESQPDSYSGGGTITIQPPQQPLTTQQKKTLTVSIYNLKEGRDTFYGYEDCNLNSEITKRTYPITVSQTGAAEKDQKPIISGLRVDPRVQVIGKDVQISARITHPFGIKNAEIEILGPTRDDRTVAFMQPLGDNFEYAFPTFGKAAGKYTGAIKATSNEQKDSPGNGGAIQRLSFEFSLTEPKNP